jgi:hypothetical protein
MVRPPGYGILTAASLEVHVDSVVRHDVRQAVACDAVSVNVVIGHAPHRATRIRSDRQRDARSGVHRERATVSSVYCSRLDRGARYSDTSSRSCRNVDSVNVQYEGDADGMTRLDVVEGIRGQRTQG